MSFFTDSATHKRAVAFDALIESGVAALTNPDVTSRIQATGVPGIVRELESAVLPNIDDDRIVVPRAERGLDTIVVVPLLGRLANRFIRKKLLPEVDAYTDYQVIEKAYSYRYETVFQPATLVRPAAGTDPESVSKWRLTAEPALALTDAHVQFNYDQNRSRRSRPWVTVFRSTIERPAGYKGMVMAHEAVHCQDIHTEGPNMFASIYLAAASELRAYHVADTIAKSQDMDVPRCDVESKRLAMLDDTSAPFVPNLDMLRWLIANKVV